MFLAEEYGKVIENVQKLTISGAMKNTELSGDPHAGTVEAKRFANATPKNYGTARKELPKAMVLKVNRYQFD